MDELGWKFLLTMLLVVVVLRLAARVGCGLAGMAAAWPTATAPALFWLARDHGVAFAERAAVSSVASCAVLAAFSLAYAHAPRRSMPALAAGCGLAVAGLAAAPAHAAGGDLASALTLAAASVALGLWMLPAHEAPRRAAPRDATWPTALAAGAVSVLTAAVGAWAGPFASGLLASLPVVGTAVVLAEHRRHGHAAAATFLRGYTGGLVGKAVFGAVFALTVTLWGAGSALSLALAAALASGLAMHHALGRAAPRAVR